MSIKSKIFVLLGLLAAMMLAAACGAPPAGTGSQAEPDTEAETASEVAAEEESAETGEAETREEHAHDEVVELSAVGLAQGEKLRVVATTNIVGDLVRNVAGDMIDLTVMLPIDSDPHTFEPAPQDVAAVTDADVVFINGLGLEEFLAELIENAGGEAPTVALSANVEPLEFEAGEGHAHGDEEGDHHEEEAHEHEEEAEEHKEDEDDHAHEDEHGHTHDEADPHIWMSPANAIVMVHNIEHALSELDPANAAAYEANAEAYKAELEDLDAWVMEQIATIPAENRKLVTDHDAFGYYADRYGLEVVGAVIPNYSTNAEPSARELAALQDAVGEYGVSAVFVGTTVNPLLAEQLAADSGIKLVPLYTGSLGEAGSGVESYIDLIRYNTGAIVAALQPES